ncbi:hypothetical protein DXG03_006992 [Asterophora parasitica]|uniref:Uncharacterized protein n=1 Tax=Asterophora parasitica TaxID=117018 RepID=A0A9P7GG18_9AGAR|nr:hypothetical protein DXG03_006992 [Asterophora parasitica]
MDSTSSPDESTTTTSTTPSSSSSNDFRTFKFLFNHGHLVELLFHELLLLEFFFELLEFALKLPEFFPDLFAAHLYTNFDADK